MLFVRLFIGITLCLSFLIAPAQDIVHGVGAQFSTSDYVLEYSSAAANLNESFEGNITSIGVLYKGTYGLTYTPNGQAVTLSFYPFLGLGGGTTFEEMNGSRFNLEVPINLELYMGSLYDRNFFLGAGLNTSFQSRLTFGSGIIFGPQVAIGTQFYSNRHLKGLRVACTWGVNNAKVDVRDAEITTNTRTLFSVAFYRILRY